MEQRTRNTTKYTITEMKFRQMSEVCKLQKGLLSEMFAFVSLSLIHI